MVGLFVAGLLASANLAPSPGQSAPISARDMVEITDISSVSIAPDGRAVAFREETGSVERNDYVLRWFVAPLDRSGPVRSVGDAGEGQWRDGVLLSEPPAWSPDGHWLYFRAIRDAQAQIWRAASDGRRVEAISHEAGNVLDFHVDPQTGAIVYRVGAAREDIVRAEQAEYDAGILVDSTVDPSRSLFRSDRIDGRAATTRLNGFWFAHGGLLGDTLPTYRLLDPATMQSRTATDAEAATLTPKAAFFDKIDGRYFTRVPSDDRRGSAYIVQTATPRIEQLAITDKPTLKEAVLCAQPQCTGQHIVNAAWSRTGNRLVFATSALGIRYSLHVWDLDTGKVRTLAVTEGTLDGGRDGETGCAVSADGAVCVAATANAPPTLQAFALRGGTPRLLADPNAALRRAGQPQFQSLAWRDAAGRPNTGQLMLPLGPIRPRPLFITYYTCDGYLRGGTGDEYPLRQLAADGVAVLCINRIALPSLGDQKIVYADAVDGVESAVNLLSERGLVDRARVGMGGLSLGGEITLWTAMHTSLLSAISVSNILLTPTYYWFNAMKGRETPDVLAKVWGLGEPDPASERWREISAFYNVGALRAPTLMQLPEHEMRVTFALAAKLSRTDTPSELWAFPDEPHIKSQPRHKLAAYERNLDWFLYWLAGVVDPDTSKRGQYARWQAFTRKPGWNDQAAARAGADSHDRSQVSTSISGSSR